MYQWISNRKVNIFYLIIDTIAYIFQKNIEKLFGELEKTAYLCPAKTKMMAG